MSMPVGKGISVVNLEDSKREVDGNVDVKEVGVPKRWKVGKLMQLIKDAKVSWRVLKKAQKGVKATKIVQMVEEVEWNQREIHRSRMSRTHRSTICGARRRRHEHEIRRTHSRLMRQ